MVARFFSKLLAVNPDEWAGVLYFFCVLLMFSFGATFARSIGMTLLIENLGGDILPFIFILIDLSVMVGSLLYAHYTNKFSGLAILGFFLISTALFSVIAQLLFIFTLYWWSGQNWIYGVFFVGFFFFYILISIHIGSVVASYFTAVQIKRLMSVINTGLPIGGVLGGTTLVVLLSYFKVQPQLLIMVLGVACLGAFGLLGIINKHLTPIRTSMRTATSQTNPVSQMLRAFKDISGSKLMIYMSIGLMLFVITSKLLEYHYQAIIYVNVYPDPTERATFFATYEIFANLAWLFIQLFLTSRIILKFGVGGSNLLYPILSALVALALFIYFFLKATGQIQGGLLVMLGLGVITQFINQEMRGALRTPANNMLFNAIPPEQWGSNKAFLNGIIFPFSTLIAGTFLIMITGIGNESSFNFSLSEQTIYYLLPLIALIVSLLGIAFAFPQWTYYDKGMFSLLNSDVDSKGENREKSLEIQVIQKKLTSSDIDQVITTLKIIRVKKQDESLNQVGNLLLKKNSYEIKKHCLQTLNAFPPSHTNLMYLGEALEKETDERVLPLILRNLARFGSNNLGQIVTKLLAHPSYSVFIEAALCLYNDPKFERKIWIETEIKTRLKQAKLPDEQAAYLYALGELQQSKYNNNVLPFLDNKNPKLSLAAFIAFIKLQKGKLDTHKSRLINTLSSNNNAMRIEALHALNDCYFLTEWSPIIQLLDDMDEEIVKESKGLLELNLAKCKSKLTETLFSKNLSVQKRFEVLSLIYLKLNEEEKQILLQDADLALQKFTEANALLKLHKSLEHQGKAYDLIAKVLQEIAEDHLDHILTIITYVSEKDLEFFQRVSHGLKSSNRANQGNALEVLSNSGEKYLVGRILKYYEECLNDVKAIGRVYITLFNKILKVEKKRYEELLLALDNDIIKACLLYIQQEKTGVLELKAVKKTVYDLLTVEEKMIEKSIEKPKTKLEQQRAVLKDTMKKILNKPHFSEMLGLEIDESWKNPIKK
jgi:ATP/ADP translocase